MTFAGRQQTVAELKPVIGKRGSSETPGPNYPVLAGLQHIFDTLKINLALAKLKHALESQSRVVLRSGGQCSRDRKEPVNIDDEWVYEDRTSAIICTGHLE